MQSFHALGEQIMPPPSRQALRATQDIDSIQALVARFNQAVEVGDESQKNSVRK